MAIPPDPHYIPAFSIEDVLLDKDTGAPLTGGIVTFFKDAQRLVMKPVFQITGTSPNYTFIQLPNPMTLSAIGTFQDALDNPVIPYFFPYNSSLGVELYYITVTSSGLVAQFTREAQPFIPGQGSGTVVPGTIENELSNPQFAEVLFDTNAASVTYNFNGVTDNEVVIAPDWLIRVTSPAAGTVTVTQLRPLGSLNLPTNPGTLLQINSTGLTSLQLRQRIVGSPNLWGHGYISGGFMAKVYGGTDKTLTLNYSQSNGTIVNQIIVSATVNGNYAYYPPADGNGSALIDLSTSGSTFPTAFIDVFLDLPVGVMMDITSVMMVATDGTSVPVVGYEQESNPRQIDHLFHYFKPGLDFKPISSYLVGWDFAMNPSQFYATGGINGSVPVNAIGANKGYYAWDQTIIFQTANNGFTVARLPKDASLQITAALNGQLAILQYLIGNQARNIFVDLVLNGISAYVEVASLPVKTYTISLWWSDNASLPNIVAGTTFFTGLDADGKPTTITAGWHEIARAHIGESNKFANITAGIIEQFNFDNFRDGTAENAQASLFAIVIGTSALIAGDVVTFQSASVVPGVIGTSPAPQTPDEVLRECQYYYQKSFPLNQTPASAVTGATGESQQIQVLGASTSQVGPIIRFPVPMINTPAITRYNVIAAGDQISSTSGGSWTATATILNSTRGFYTTGTSPGGSAAGINLSLLHWTANALLGTF